MTIKLWMISIILLYTSQCIFAQGKEKIKLDPKTTEVWEPIPPKVNLVKGVPTDAIVLFDGSSFANWESEDGQDVKWAIIDGAMQVLPKSGSIVTKESFGDCQLHIEWASPSIVKGEGQGRGNSGIFLQGRYEIQVLDSYESKTYANGQASSIYKQHIPLVNACKPPGEWQTYDIIYTAPRFNKAGLKVSSARVTVLHNNVLTLNNVEIWGATTFTGLPANQAHGDAPLMLQDHRDLVRYRNIWIRPL